MRPLHPLWALGLLLVANACSPEVDSYRRGESICEPGATKKCSCSGRYDSVQVCADDGARYASCRCATKLRFLSAPDPINTAGTPFVTQPVIVAEDDEGQTVAGAAGFVVLGLGADQGVLTGAKIGAFESGLASFSGLSTTLVGEKNLVASTDLFDGTQASAAFTVLAATAQTLEIQSAPPAGEVGDHFDDAVVVVARDAFGNLADGFTSEVSLAIASASPGPNGLFGHVNTFAQGGVATFTDTMSFGRAGSVVLEATGEGVTSARTSRITLRQPDLHLTRTRITDSESTFCVQSAPLISSPLLHQDQSYSIAACSQAQTMLGQDSLLESPSPQWSKSSVNLAVYDAVADIYWRDPVLQTSQSFGDAQQTCASLNDLDPLNGYYWRLSTLPEMMTLVDFSYRVERGAPTVPDVIQVPGIAQSYWTQSPADSGGTQRHIMGFENHIGIVRAANGLAEDVMHGVACVGSRVASVGNPDPNSDDLRYTHDDETVLDRFTALQWQRDFVQHTWQDALLYCDGLELGGHDDWHLPNEKELASLFHFGKPTPHLSELLNSTNPHVFWSSSPKFEAICTADCGPSGSYVSGTVSAYQIDFATRQAPFADARITGGTSALVRCVR